MSLGSLTRRGVDSYTDCFLDDAGDEDVCNGNTLREERWASRVLLRIRVWLSKRPVCV